MFLNRKNYTRASLKGYNTARVKTPKSMANKNQNIVININSGTFIRALLIIGLFYLLYMIRDIVAVVLFSVVIASGIEPLAHWFQERKVPRLIAIILIYLSAFLLLSLIFYLVIPPTFTDLSEFVSNVPRYINQPLETTNIQEIFPQLSEPVVQILLSSAGNIKEFVGNVTKGFFQTTASAFGGAMSFFMVIVISFYLSVQEKGIENFLRIITPQKQEKYVIDLWKRTKKKIGSWMKGQMLLGLLVGIFVYLGLSILQIPYALTFALLAAVFELIPVFGPVFAAIPPIVITFLTNPSLALAVLVLYVIIQQFENHLIYPLVVRKVVGVPPILVVLALIIGAKLGGFFGILLAVPTATFLMEIFTDIEKEKGVVQQ